MYQPSRSASIRFLLEVMDKELPIVQKGSNAFL